MEDLEDVDAHKMGCSCLYEHLWSGWRKGARGMLMLGDASSGGNAREGGATSARQCLFAMNVIHAGVS